MFIIDKLHMNLHCFDILPQLHLSSSYLDRVSFAKYVCYATMVHLSTFQHQDVRLLNEWMSSQNLNMISYDWITIVIIISIIYLYLLIK